jgi:hypothetical protein
MAKTFTTEIEFNLDTFKGSEKDFLLSFKADEYANANEYSNCIYLDVEITFNYLLSIDEVDFKIEHIVFKDISTIKFDYNFKNIIEVLEEAVLLKIEKGL